MSNPSDKFRYSKLDQSPYLFHFIKGSEYHARITLNTILRERRLRSLKNDFICFTASPITQCGALFETKVASTQELMYQPYGIGFSRDILIRDYGVKNVIYGDSTDASVVKAIGMDWRFLELDVVNNDFEWLREWRFHGSSFDFSKFPPEHMIVITPTHESLIEQVVHKGEYKSIDYDDNGKPYDDWVEFYDRRWKGISLEDIRLQNLVNDLNVSASTLTQRVGEDMMDEICAIEDKRSDEITKLIMDAIEASKNKK